MVDLSVLDLGGKLEEAVSSRLDPANAAREAWALADLGASPYATDVFAAPPLAMVWSYPYVHFSDNPAATSLLDIALGGLVAAMMVRVSQAWHSRSNSGARLAIIFIAMALRSQWDLENFGVVLSVYGAAIGSESVAATGLAVAVHVMPTNLLLAWPLMNLSTTRLKPGESAPPDVAKGSKKRFLAKFLIASVFLMATSTSILLLQKGKKSRGICKHWMSHAYGPIFRVQDLSPNASLLWYLSVQCFPEMKRMFLWLMHLQPLVLAIPVALELSASPIALLLCQASINNVFRQSMTAGQLALQALLSLAGSDTFRGIPGAHLYFAFFLAAVSLVLMHVVKQLWIDAGTANANFYWAFNITLAIAQLAFAVVIIRKTLRGEEERDGEKQKRKPE
mmetsp:Transcript_9079/g.23327  ORF Transcript_9079/g.23327 Transcript_9079/m.23327 type:complete len:393 (-) Transcript_9079:102-1280(-)